MLLTISSRVMPSAMAFQDSGDPWVPEVAHPARHTTATINEAMMQFIDLERATVGVSNAGLLEPWTQ